MIRGGSLLVSLVYLVDYLPWPSEPPQRPRGCPKRYSERLSLKALVIMIVRRLYSAYALLSFLEQDDPVPRQLRGLLREHGRCPSRRTWERRLARLPETLPGLIGCTGRHVTTLLQPWAAHGRAVSIDHGLGHGWRRVAQAAPGAGRDASHLDCYGSGVEHIGLAWLVVRLEATSGRHGGLGLDSPGR